LHPDDLHERGEKKGKNCYTWSGTVVLRQKEVLSKREERLCGSRIGERGGGICPEGGVVLVGKAS